MGLPGVPREAPEEEVRRTSHYTVCQTELKDEKALVAALADLGLPAEVHATPAALYGYEGDERPERAHVVVRRAHVGHASNDIGFVREADGRYRAIISEFDGRRYDAAWLGKLAQRYARNVVVRAAAARGQRVVGEETLPDGRIRLALEV